MKIEQVGRLRRRQKSAVLTGLQVFQSVLMLLQLYLFVSVLESILAGKMSTAIPAAVLSIVILVANFWMFRGVSKLDQQS